MAQNPLSKRESPTLPIYKEKNAETKRDVFLETRNKKRGQCSQLSIVPVFIDQRVDGKPLSWLAFWRRNVFIEIRVLESQEIQHPVDANRVDTLLRIRHHSRFCVEGYAQTGGREHR